MSRLLAASCLILSGTARAQAQEPDYGRQLAAVHSVESARAVFRAVEEHDSTDVLILLDSLKTVAWYHRRWRSYQLDGGNDPCVRYRTAPPDTWRLADFNQDGRPDLFATDPWNRAYVLLNQGLALPRRLSLNFRGGQSSDAHTYRLLSLKGRAAVVHFHVEARNYLSEEEPRIWYDTLVYHAGAFVEYNAHPGAPRPSRLELAIQGGSVFYRRRYRLSADLTTGQVSGYVDYDKRTGHAQFTGPLTYRLPPAQLDTLCQQAAYLNLVRLRRHYELRNPGVHISDADTARLTLHYPGRPPVQVEDCGLLGAHSLAQLYGILLRAHEQAVEQRRPAAPASPPGPGKNR